MPFPFSLQPSVFLPAVFRAGRLTPVFHDFIDTRAAIEMAPAVAKIMADKLNKGKEWQKEQVESFNNAAKKYLI